MLRAKVLRWYILHYTLGLGLELRVTVSVLVTVKFEDIAGVRVTGQRMRLGSELG
jgi:hypothetical protein